jgi:excinuclease ABC subunit B
MYNGDQARKKTLVDYGFRLPSALDNRPLKYEEFMEMVRRILYVSATPGELEIRTSAVVAEQIIRPTGLIDPLIEVRPTEGQIHDLAGEIAKRAKKGERTLVTTLTKRMAEELTRFLKERDLRVSYIHSEVNTLDRVEIVRDLRLGEFDCLVGVNLLREGLDMPEVSLVAILDADKEGFLRSGTSLLQTAGRAARHINGEVIFYADNITESMKKVIDITNTRRIKQVIYNKDHGITPVTIVKAIKEGVESYRKAKEVTALAVGETEGEYDLLELIGEIEREMGNAARNLEFEKAIVLRDERERLKGMLGDQGGAGGKGQDSGKGEGMGRVVGGGKKRMAKKRRKRFRGR